MLVIPCKALIEVLRYYGDENGVRTCIEQNSLLQDLYFLNTIKGPNSGLWSQITMERATEQLENRKGRH